MTTPPTSPREALAHTLAAFADEPDSTMAVVATRNIPVRGAVTGLTWGNLRALSAEAGTKAASAALSRNCLAEIAAHAAHALAVPPVVPAEVERLIGSDVPALLAEVERLRAELAARPTRAEVLRETAPEMDAIAHEYGVFGVGSRLRQLADAAEAGESR
ncbi:hypothetical protein ACFVDU_04265 [Streptomyces albidoflavus]